MANISLTASVGPNSASASLVPTDTRFIEFLDDLRNLHYPEIDDGAGGTRVLNRVEAAQKWMDDLLAGQVAFAQGLEDRRKDIERRQNNPATDLAGNERAAVRT